MPTFNSHIDFFFNSVFEDGKDVSSLNSPAEVPVVKALLTSGLLKLVGTVKGFYTGPSITQRSGPKEGSRCVE